MAYNVKTADFEGPFQLLLHLVSQRRVDIANIQITDIADQYLAYIDKLQSLDMDVASDFIEVAASLLAIKASSLLPEPADLDLDEDIEDLPPAQAREFLLSRLLAYKQFKNAAAALGARQEAEARMHPRRAGLESQFLHVIPDYLENTTLESLAAICARLASRRQVFLLQARHVAARTIPVETRIGELSRRLSASQHLTFSELLEGNAKPVFVVVTFLAILELYHRGMIDLQQTSPAANIDISWIEPEQRQPASQQAPAPETPVDTYLRAQDAKPAAAGANA